MYVRNSLGEILQETADISFDTTRAIFFNPQTGKDYGPSAPSGGWPISWYDSGGQVIVPVGPGAVSKTAAEAAQMKATVTSQLAAQAPARVAAGTATQVMINAASVMGVPTTAGSATVQPSTPAMTSLVSSASGLISIVSSFGWMGWAAIAAGAYFLFFKGGRLT